MLVSVVIPVYNTDAHMLRQCVGSVACHDDVEILLINDGSTDEGTNAECEALAERYSVIRYIANENLGPSVTRNIGIKESQGEYIMFLDSDDWWNGGFIERAREILSSSDVKQDMFICGAEKVEFTTGEREYIGVRADSAEAWQSGREALLTLLNRDPRYEWYVWRYLIRRELLISKDLFFREGIYYEDVELTPRIFAAAGAVTLIPDAFVNYRFHNPTSILNTPSVRKSNDKVLVVSLLTSFADELRDPALRGLILSNISDLYLSAYGDFINGSALDLDALKKSLNILKWNKTKFGKTVRTCTKLLGFKLGTKAIKIILKK